MGARCCESSWAHIYLAGLDEIAELSGASLERLEAWRWSAEIQLRTTAIMDADTARKILDCERTREQQCCTATDVYAGGKRNGQDHC